MPKQTWKKISGVWKDISNIWRKSSGIWQSEIMSWRNIGGVWKECMDYSIYDIDGNVYTYITIGTQQWFVENLKTTKYADGTPIPNISNYNDWFLPSKDELAEMYFQLYKYGIGNFVVNNGYVSSSEAPVDSDAYFITVEMVMDQEVYQPIIKSEGAYFIRPCRVFTSSTVYALRDIGPAGGYIFWKSGNDYLEAAPSDIGGSQVWSNIDSVAIGTTGTAIGTGQANTTAIINQISPISLITSWTDVTGWTTFTSLGSDIISAINSNASSEYAQTNDITVVPGSAYQIIINATINSGSDPQLYIWDKTHNVIVIDSNITLVNGINYINITIPVGCTTIYIDVLNVINFTPPAVAVNFSATFVTNQVSTDSAAKLCNDLTSDMLWSQDTEGAYCYYDNDIANKTPYGGLYNWYAVDNAHGLAPTGWRVPLSADFATLSAFLGGDTIAGGKLKEMGLAHWNAPNTGATNEAGFTAVGGGRRTTSFIYLGEVADMWVDTAYDANTAYFRECGKSIISLGNSISTKYVGLSIRCMRDI